MIYMRQDHNLVLRGLVESVLDFLSVASRLFGIPGMSRDVPSAVRSSSRPLIYSVLLILYAVLGIPTVPTGCVGIVVNTSHSRS